MARQRFTCDGACARDYVKHTRWETRLGDQLRERQCRGSRVFRRLHDHGIADCQAWGKRAAQKHER